MKIDAHNLEELKNEYVSEYCSIHGGDFTKKDVEDGFTAGFYNEKPPANYHAFVAWQAGQRHGGHKLF